jgi:hypothetical protein
VTPITLPFDILNDGVNEPFTLDYFTTDTAV